MGLKLLYFLIVTIGVLSIVHDVCAMSRLQRYRKSLVEKTKQDLSTIGIDTKSVDSSNTTDALLVTDSLSPKEVLLLLQRTLGQYRPNKHKHEGHNHPKRKSHSHRSRSMDVRRKTSADAITSPEHPSFRTLEVIAAKIMKFLNSTKASQTEEKIRKGGRRKARRHQHTRLPQVIPHLKKGPIRRVKEISASSKAKE